MIIARAHIIISAWIIHAARLCQREEFAHIAAEIEVRIVYRAIYQDEH